MNFDNIQQIWNIGSVIDLSPEWMKSKNPNVMQFGRHYRRWHQKRNSGISVYLKCNFYFCANHRDNACNLHAMQIILCQPEWLTGMLHHARLDQAIDVTLRCIRNLKDVLQETLTK